MTDITSRQILKLPELFKHCTVHYINYITASSWTHISRYVWRNMSSGHMISKHSISKLGVNSSLLMMIICYLKFTTVLKTDPTDFCIITFILHGPQRTTNYQLCTSFLCVLWHEDMITANSARHILFAGNSGYKFQQLLWLRCQSIICRYGNSVCCSFCDSRDTEHSILPLTWTLNFGHVSEFTNNDVENH